MTYALTFVADMGAANTGLTVRAQLYDSDGTPNGAELTADMVEVDSTNAPGVYAYRATIPDDHDGIFAIYNNADKTQRVSFAVNPVEVEITALADAVLERGMSNVEDSADATSLAALVLAAFESVISGVTWTIYKTDHATTFTTRTVTLDSAASPIVEVT